MENKEKLGFFKKLILVISDFRVYPFLVKFESVYRAVGYLLLLILLLTSIISFYLVSQFKNMVISILDNYDQSVPEFTLQDGVLELQENVYQKIEQNTYLVLDTNYTYETFTKSPLYEKSMIYDDLISITKNSFTIEINGEIVYQLMFDQLPIVLDKESLHSQMETIVQNKQDLFKIFLFVEFFVFVSYCLSIFIKMFVIALIIKMISMGQGIMLRLRDFFKIAIYTYTLPFIIEIISLLVVGPGKTYTEIASLLLEYIYIIYALRAMKLDAFIEMVGKNSGTDSSQIYTSSALNNIEEQNQDSGDSIHGEANQTDFNQNDHPSDEKEKEEK